MRIAGGNRSEHAGMSNDKGCEIHPHRKSKGSHGRLIRVG